MMRDVTHVVIGTLQIWMTTVAPVETFTVVVDACVLDLDRLTAIGTTDLAADLVGMKMTVLEIEAHVGIVIMDGREVQAQKRNLLPRNLLRMNEIEEPSSFSS